MARTFTFQAAIDLLYILKASSIGQKTVWLDLDSSLHGGLASADPSGAVPPKRLKFSGADLSLDRPAINDTSAETYPAEEKS
jgi:hypothetical protein